VGDQAVLEEGEGGGVARGEEGEEGGGSLGGREGGREGRMIRSFC